jgi:hypothetical protein
MVTPLPIGSRRNESCEKKYRNAGIAAVAVNADDEERG